MEYKNLTYSNRNRKNGGRAVCYFHRHTDWNRVSGAEQLLRNWSGREINPISASSLFAESKRRPDVKP
jgi:hypothetical protein